MIAEATNIGINTKEEFYNSFYNVRSQFYASASSLAQRISSCFHKAWNNVLDVSSGMYYYNEFYKCCKEKGVFHINEHGVMKAINEWPWEVRHGDQILTSAPEESCKPTYRQCANQKLLENLNIANEIFEYVKKKVPHSPNYESRSDSSRMSFGGSVMFLKGRELVVEVERLGYGVCEEMAMVGKYHAIDTRPNINVETVSIAGGTHTFLVIGRNQDSISFDYNTWGENAVILDSWSGKYYPLYAVKDELYDFVHMGYYNKEYKQSPYVRRFNPQKQAIVINNRHDTTPRCNPFPRSTSEIAGQT